MKKILSIALAIVLSFSFISISAFAVEIGDDEIEIGSIYTVNRSVLNEKLSNNMYAKPGTSVYCVVDECTATDNRIRKARIIPDDSESKMLVDKCTNATRKCLRTNDGKYYYGIEIPIKEYNITVNTYDDPFTFCGEINVIYQNGEEVPYPITFNSKYDNLGNSGLLEYPQVFYYDLQDDISLSNEQEDFIFEARATGRAIAKVSYNNDDIYEIESMFGNTASLIYHNVKGEISRIKDAQITIKNAGNYLYEYTDGILKTIPCEKVDDTFKIQINSYPYSFKTYIVSDVKLIEDELKVIPIPRLSIENKTAILDSKEDTFTVDLTLIDVVDLKSLSLSDFYYDNIALELVDAEWNVTGENGKLSGIDISKEKMVIAYSSATDLNGKLATLTFKPKTNDYEANFKLWCQCFGYDENQEEIWVDCANGDIEVCKVAKGDLNTDGVVNSDDAIYTLYHYYFPETYPTEQDLDFNRDGKFDEDDAIYLLFYSYFPDDYPIN